MVTDSGKAYPIPVAEIPSSLESTELSAVELLSSAAQRDANDTVAHFFLPENHQNLGLGDAYRKRYYQTLGSQ